MFFLLQIILISSIISSLLSSILFLYWKKFKKNIKIKKIIIFLFITYIIGLLIVTIFSKKYSMNWKIDFPGITSQHLLNLIPFIWIRNLIMCINNNDYFRLQSLIKQLVSSIILFVPIGFFSPLVFPFLKNLKKITFTIIITSFCIEFVQYFIGRAADIDDIILNYIGGYIGYIICRTFFFKRKYSMDYDICNSFNADK